MEYWIALDLFHEMFFDISIVRVEKKNDFLRAIPSQCSIWDTRYLIERMRTRIVHLTTGLCVQPTIPTSFHSFDATESCSIWFTKRYIALVEEVPPIHKKRFQVYLFKHVIDKSLTDIYVQHFCRTKNQWIHKSTESVTCQEESLELWKQSCICRERERERDTVCVCSLECFFSPSPTPWNETTFLIFYHFIWFCSMDRYDLLFACRLHWCIICFVSRKIGESSTISKAEHLNSVQQKNDNKIYDFGVRERTKNVYYCRWISA